MKTTFFQLKCTCSKSACVLLKSSKLKFSCFFKKVRMTTELHLAEPMPFHMVTHNLSACCILLYNHASHKWDNLFNTKAEFSFILHLHPRNSYQCISINC